MSTSKKVASVVGILLLLAGVSDAVRYLKPDARNRQQVNTQRVFPPAAANEIILVYNAWGGIYPGIADFINKEFFPASYPCNLCYQTFGTFSMKDEWRQYLDRLPYKKTELHKDNFQRFYAPGRMSLPAILVTNGSAVQVLASAKELNQQKTLEELIMLVENKLKP